MLKKLDSGMTLIELVTVIAIAILLVSISFPVYLNQNAKASRAITINNVSAVSSFVKDSITSGSLVIFTPSGAVFGDPGSQFTSPSLGSVSAVGLDSVSQSFDISSGFYCISKTNNLETYIASSVNPIAHLGSCGAELAPSPVTGLTANPGSSQVTLTWNPSNDTSVIGYSVSYSTDNGSTWIPVQNVDAMTTSSTIYMLANGQSYLFGVNSKNSFSNSSMSTVVATPRANNQPSPVFGASYSYGFIASAAITSSYSSLDGDIAYVGAGTFSYTTSTGTISQATNSDGQVVDATALYNYLFNYPATSQLNTAELGGRTLTRGVYSSVTALSLNGTLTFDAQGDSSAIFVVRSMGAKNTTAQARMTLINGAKASNVYFVLGGAETFGAGSQVVGNYLTGGAITFGAGCTLTGRAFAINGDITAPYLTQVFPPA